MGNVGKCAPHSISSACCPSFYLLVSPCNSVFTSTFPLLPILDNVGMSASFIHLTHVTVSSDSHILSSLSPTSSFHFCSQPVIFSLWALMSMQISLQWQSNKKFIFKEKKQNVEAFRGMVWLHRECSRCQGSL